MYGKYCCDRDMLWSSDTDQISPQLLLLLAITYIWPPTLAKLAIVFLYHRINPDMGFRFCLHLVGLSIFTFTLVFTILFAGPCNPLSSGTGQCLNNIAVAQAVLNIVSDAVLIVLPVHMIHQLNMPLKQRLVVGCILALGSAYVLHAPCHALSSTRIYYNIPE